MTHIVIVGLGSIGRRHAANLSRLVPDARFTFVRHSGKSDETSRSFDARVVGGLDAVLDEDVDLAVVATPSANHIDVLPVLVERGWPLLVEKPIVTEIRDVEAISDLVARSPVAIRAAGFNLRHLPSLRRVRRLLQDGALGNVTRATLIAGQWLPAWRPGVDYRTVYSADATRGGGVELDLAHEFDVARWLFGEMRVEYAFGAHLSALELAANDTSVSVLRPVSGSGPVVTVSLDYVAPRRVRWYEVVGDGGRIEWSLDGRLELTTAAGTQGLPVDGDDFDVARTYTELVSSVLDDVAAGEGARAQSLADGLASTRLALEVRDWEEHP
jgi:predicted dehydrogenase